MLDARNAVTGSAPSDNYKWETQNFRSERNISLSFFVRRLRSCGQTDGTVPTIKQDGTERFPFVLSFPPTASSSSPLWDVGICVDRLRDASFRVAPQKPSAITKKVNSGPLNMSVMKKTKWSLLGLREDYLLMDILRCPYCTFFVVALGFCGAMTKNLHLRDYPHLWMWDSFGALVNLGRTTHPFCGWVTARSPILLPLGRMIDERGRGELFSIKENGRGKRSGSRRNRRTRELNVKALLPIIQVLLHRQLFYPAGFNTGNWSFPYDVWEMSYWCHTTNR